MTAANRILIGIGWAGIALFTILRARGSLDGAVRRRDGFLAEVVTLDRDIGLEVVFLLAATLWAFLVPLGGGIDLLDLGVLVGLYVAYIIRDLLTVAISDSQFLLLFSGIYVTLGFGLFVSRREEFLHLIGQTSEVVRGPLSTRSTP